VVPALVQDKAGGFPQAVRFKCDLRVHNFQKKSFSLSAITSNFGCPANCVKRWSPSNDIAIKIPGLNSYSRHTSPKLHAEP
jgi:hypothetical protein